MTDIRRQNAIAYQTLLDLSTEEGINASGRDEVYGCIFGRDSALTILKILKVHSKNPHAELLQTCRRALLTLVSLQGKETNIESGEQLGKFIHEFRKDRYQHLLGLEKPWYIYSDNYLRNYDSLDSTPLALIAIYKYWQLTQDKEFLDRVLPAVEAGLNWIISYGDMDKDALLEYKFDPSRKHGGLVVQSWTDSGESLQRADGTFPKYSIAPVEVQAFAWLAFRLWSDYYLTQTSEFGRDLYNRAKKIKKEFNKQFIFEDEDGLFAVQALDGDKQQIKTVTGSPMLVLWAAYTDGQSVECILDQKYVDEFVARAFKPDMFVEDAGLRTMSSKSPTFNPLQNSYHNGSFWPVLNGLVVEGLENFGFVEQAARLRQASLLPIQYFGTPIELYIKTDDGYLEYRNSGGQTSCRRQAWSAAVLLDLTTP